MKTKMSLLLVACLISIIACKKDKTTSPGSSTPVNTSGTMNFKINGTNYSATSYNNTLINASQGGQTGRRLDIRGSFAGNKTLVLTVSNWDWQNPPLNGIVVKKYDTQTIGPNTVCQDISGGTYCDGALGTYLFGSSYHMTISEVAEGYIQISSCEATNKKVSGSFYFITSDLSETVFDTIEGTFTNQVYTGQ